MLESANERIDNLFMSRFFPRYPRGDESK